MLMLRLQRVGRRNEAHFKIVVIEKSKGPKSHKYVDIVGSYNPKLGNVIIDEDKAKKWLANGVQPSDTVYNMLVTKGIIDGKKKNVLPKKSPIIDEEKIAREKAEAEAKIAKAAEEKAAAEEAEKAEAESTEETPSEESAETETEEVKEEVKEESSDVEETKEEVAEDKKEDK
ncbi:MAG: 30S ribosomal protein S16 [Candidatus Pacebacteria bacterium]|nr:30S ribosomal protein S16 [Candidatus Paceibacterota bacterium]